MMERAELLAALGRLKVETGSLACLGCGHEHNCGTHGCAILQAAAEALRGPTREMVERMRGRWINKHSAFDHKIFICSECGKQISIQGENLNFCPYCMAPMTDKAVEMVMERLEAQHEAD